MPPTLDKDEPNPSAQLHAAARHFTNECVAINLTCRNLLPEPHRRRMNSRLSMIAWRMSRYLADSEAGTTVTPESICQARMIRITMENAAHCYAQALNSIESNSGPVPQILVDNGHRLAALASIQLPTFPEELNRAAYRLDIDSGQTHTSKRDAT